jgi:NAD dependent epimerase/dehydratase
MNKKNYRFHMEINRKHVLITGAGGFIGSHLTEMLVRNGCKVRAFVHYNSTNRWGWIDSFPKEIQDQIEIFTGDIIDPYGVREAMQGIDIVFHLAALIGIPYSYHSPDIYVDTNVKGTLNILQAARSLGIERVIQTSTSEIYGTAQHVPISELHPVNPQSPYAATKASADMLALTFYRSFDIPVIVARPFNTYGPRQSARAVIPTMIAQIAKGHQKISLGDLTPTRDFNFVLDTCRGFIQLASCDEALGEVINIGSNFEISIGDTFKMIASLMNSDATLVEDSKRIRPEKSEVFRLWCDNSNLQRLTGFKPEYPLEKGLQLTIDWFLNPANLALYKETLYNV